MGVKVREKVKGSGDWWVFINYKRKRTSRQIGSLKAANKVKEQIEARLKLGQDALPQEKARVPTVEQYYETFKRNYVDSALRISTGKSYASNFKTHIIPALGALPLDEVRPAHVEAFIADLVTVKKKARATIATIVKELCKLFNHARKHRIITENPASGVSDLYRQAKVVHEEVQPLTAAEVPVFLAVAQEYWPEYYVLFLCAIHTGLRSGELAGLQWGDIDFAGKFLIVRRNVVRGRIEKTKTSKSRRVDVSDALLAEFQALKRNRQTDYLAAGKNEIPDWVFLGPGRLVKDEDNPGKLKREAGKRVEMYNVKNRHFYKCLEKAKLRRIRFHDLRHTFASLLIQNGESLAYVKEQLGHASIKMTVDVYGHLVPGANREAVNRLPTINSAAAAMAAEA